jgi:hypothetical protein
MKHANVLKHPVFYAIPVVFGLFVYMLFQSGMIHGDFFGAEKMTKKLEQKQKKKAAPKAATNLKPYSENTPNIYRTYSATGQTLFTNRIQNKDLTTNNELSNGDS